jgi:L-type amino acid transporter 9
MAYGELGTMLPYAGGEYSYYLAAFGSFPGFMYCWVSVIILKPAMMGIVCLTFSSYAVKGFLSTPAADSCGHDHGNEHSAAPKILGVITIGDCQSRNIHGCSTFSLC